jgi:hypothetical protein
MMSREMVEVGVEGDHFHIHFESDECAKAGCVPLTPEIKDEIETFNRRWDAQREAIETHPRRP